MIIVERYRKLSVIVPHTRCQISGYLGLWMNREKTDFLTCGPWSGGTSVTLRLLEWAAGRWCHAAEELLGCGSFRAAWSDDPTQRLSKVRQPDPLQTHCARPAVLRWIDICEFKGRHATNPC